MDESAGHEQRLSMATISVCMIVRDEASLLPRCLNSIKGQFDEVIVLDTGSTDHSPKIADGHGARVFYSTWQGDFSLARNESIAYATGTHVLILDADETVTGEAAALLRAFADHHPLALGRVSIYSKWMQTPTQELTIVGHATRFFPRDPNIRFFGPIHEQVVALEGTPPRLDTGVRIDHAGYALSADHMRQKSLRNISLLKRALLEDPDNGYYHYQMARSLVAIDDLATARLHFEHSLAVTPRVYHYHADLLLAYLRLLKQINQPDKLWQVVREALVEYPDYPDLYFFVGKTMIDLHVPNLQMIRQCFEICLQLGDHPHKYPTVHGVGSFLAHYNLGVYFESLANYEQAVRHYTESAQMGYQPASEALKRVRANHDLTRGL